MSADVSLLPAATRVPWGSAPLPAVLPGLPVLPAVPLPPAEEQQRRPALLCVDRRGRAGDVGILQDIWAGARRAAGSTGQDDELGEKFLLRVPGNGHRRLCKLQCFTGLRPCGILMRNLRA